jgi:hypothetical protein
MKARLYFFLMPGIPGSGLSTKPLVAFYNGAILSLFKSLGLQDYEHRGLKASTPGDHIADEAELPRPHSLVAVFIPESGVGYGN